MEEWVYDGPRTEEGRPIRVARTEMKLHVYLYVDGDHLSLSDAKEAAQQKERYTADGPWYVQDVKRLNYNRVEVTMSNFEEGDK